ncbi:MAG: hypothetical protein IJU76_05985 [Desulfovibrionaceae bacterium]|nr:hypothetical protein [Desulfovibrionaceae bacterium]
MLKEEIMSAHNALGELFGLSEDQADLVRDVRRMLSNAADIAENFEHNLIVPFSKIVDSQAIHREYTQEVQ